MRVGTSGAVTAWASLRMNRGGFFDGVDSGDLSDLPIPLLGGSRQLRPLPGSSVSRARLDEVEVEVRHGVRCTVVNRAVLDEMRRAGNLREAVIALDMSAAAELTSIQRMRTYVERQTRGSVLAMVLEALDLASEHSRSPAESRMRLHWCLDAELPLPLCNPRVYSLDGRLLGVPDLFDPVAGVVGEYDGALHRERRRHRHDVTCEDAFRRHGLEYFTVVAGDSPEVIVERMLNTRARAGFLAPERRDWTLRSPGPPADSSREPSDLTLTERLDLRDWQRARAEECANLPVPT